MATSTSPSLDFGHECSASTVSAVFQILFEIAAPHLAFLTTYLGVRIASRSTRLHCPVSTLRPKSATAAQISSVPTFPWLVRESRYRVPPSHRPTFSSARVIACGVKSNGSERIISSRWRAAVPLINRPGRCSLLVPFQR